MPSSWVKLWVETVARNIERLSALAVSRAKAPGYYPDGAGLYLHITSTGAKSWVYRFMLAGKAREMGLGPFPDTTLSEARGNAMQFRKLRREGIDPIEWRKAAKAQARLEAASSITFKECAAAYIKAHKAGWRNAKHADQWESTLTTYVEPVFGALPVQGIDTGLVMRALEPIWSEKPETASRLRGRVENILDWARVRGYRTGENPARWRGHLDKLLPRQSKIARVEHHAALPYSQVGAFMASLRAQEGVAARMLEFVILTGARTGEAIGAHFSEIKDDVWVVPAGRMKGGREHRVPLSPAAAAIVETMRALGAGDYLFPGGKTGKPLSNMAMLVLLRRMNRADLTVHGFRSTFRDWAAERTNFPSEVVEMALAHAVSGKVEAAYRRGDLFEKRRKLMEAWASYCAAPARGGQVVAMRRAGE
jgi:integrase